jgi:site-specific DNA recombinase
VFELAQEEFRRLRSAGNHTSTINCFASRIVCGDCGGFYGRKVWHSSDKYRSIVWHCNNKFQKRKYCSTPTIKEDIVKKAFIDAFNSLITNKADILSHYNIMIENISDTSDLEYKIKAVDKEISDVKKVVEGFISENARLTVNQQEYNKKVAEFLAQHNKLQKQREDLLSEITIKKARKIQMHSFIAILKKQNPLLTEFDEKLWSTLLSAMVIKSDTEVLFKFKDGMELPWVI